MKSLHRPLLRGLPSLVACLVIFGPAAISAEIARNPLFADDDGNGFPDGWSAAPGGGGPARVLASLPGGGLRFRDDDGIRPLGIEQWVPASEGVSYTAYADVLGQGSVALSLSFSAEQGGASTPPRSTRASAGNVAKVAAKAPAGMHWARLALYSSKKEVCNLVVREAGLRATGPGGEPAAEPQLTIDFETGDTSQIRSGAALPDEIAVSGFTDGPVREGMFSAKIAMPKGRGGGTIPVLRAAPAGVARHGWSLYLPKNFDATSARSTLARWDDKDTGRVYPGADESPTSIVIENGKYVFRLRSQAVSAQIAELHAWDLGPIDEDLDRWTDWVIEADWQPPRGDGWVRVFKNDRLVLRHEGSTYFEGKSSGPLFSVGLEMSADRRPETSGDAVAFIDAIRMRQGETSSYDSVAPSSYSPRPRTR